MDDGRQVACYGALPGTAPGQATCWGVMVDRKSVTEDGWADLLVGDFDPHTPVAVSCPRASRSAYGVQPGQRRLVDEQMLHGWATV